MQLVISILITMIPIILWGVYFYLKNPRREKIKDVLRIFFLGIFSIVPVFIFHNYFLDISVEYLSELFHITDLAILPALLELILMVIFIVVFIFIFAAVQSLHMWGIHKLKWRNSFKTIYKKMYNLAPLSIFFVLFLILEIVFNLSTELDFISSLVGSTIIFAVFEEYFKFIINPFLAFRKINSIGSAVINSLYIGLAFAFIENILFFLYIQNSPDFIMVYVYRSIFTTMLHVSASGIIGYFYGISLFSESIMANYEIEKGEYKVLGGLRKFLHLKKKSMFQSVSVTRGFFIAAAIHVTFNLLLFLDFKIIPAALIIVLTLFIVYLLHSRRAQIQYGIIGTQAMPEEDFERLRLQISVSKHLKEIQSSRQTFAPSEKKH